MKGKVFIDTNVFIYLYSDDEPEKKTLAIKQLENNQCLTSTQALNELSNVFTRKWKLSAQDVENVISEISQVCEIKLLDVDTVKKALKIHDEYGYSYYDCLMLSSALQNKCEFIFSEDMQDGQKIEDLEIINIFKFQ